MNVVREMEIIDFMKRGNCIRLYLGKNGEQWGDDWNDAPYEHNAETVYREYVNGIADYAIPLDASVYEPCDGEWNSRFSKEDMIKRIVPCLIIVAREVFEDAGWAKDTFKAWLGDANAVHIYFGDSIEEVEKKIFSAHGCNIGRSAF